MSYPTSLFPKLQYNISYPTSLFPKLHDTMGYPTSGAGNLLIGFLSELLIFVQKRVNEQFAQKNERFAHLLIFGEQPEQFAHIAHPKRGNEQITHFLKKKPIQNMLKNKI